MGLTTGLTIVGNIGSDNRMSYTAIGDQVNLASRLESANRFYGTSILLSEQTREGLAAERFVTRLVDQLVAYGKSVPIRVYELVGRHGEVDASTLATVTDYETAFALYQGRAFAEAVQRLERHPDDGPSRVLLLRCRGHLERPPPEGWDGSFLLTSK